MSASACLSRLCLFTYERTCVPVCMCVCMCVYAALRRRTTWTCLLICCRGFSWAGEHCLAYVRVGVFTAPLLVFELLVRLLGLACCGDNIFGFGFGVARVQLHRRRLADSLQRRLTNGLESTQAFDILCLFPNSSHYLMLDSILVTLALIRTCILLITIVSVLVSCSSPSYPHVYPAHHHRIRTCILLIVVSPYSSAV